MKLQDQPTIALIISHNHQGNPELFEALTSADEILEFELALLELDQHPMQRVLEYRAKRAVDEEEFADFVEGLLSQPFVKPEVQEHAVQWFKSRAKIEAFQKSEDTASHVISNYAFEVYRHDPTKTDFFLAGPRSRVRIRVFELKAPAQSRAA